MYTPPGLNHSLTIEKTNTNDTGRYRCRVAIDDTQIMKFINLTVVRGMHIVYYLVMLRFQNLLLLLDYSL